MSQLDSVWKPDVSHRYAFLCWLHTVGVWRPAISRLDSKFNKNVIEHKVLLAVSGFVALEGAPARFRFRSVLSDK